MNPFYFEQLPRSGKIFVSNLLGEWSLVEGKGDLVDAIDDRQIIFTSASLSPENFQRAAVAKLTKKYLTAFEKPGLVMVVPTLRCDHSCSYCQVSRAPLNSFSHDLQLSPVEVVDWFLSISNSLTKLEFQGGEPLLRQDYLRSIVEVLDDKTHHRHEVVIATALGPDLSEEFLDWCNARGVKFSVSFDGDPVEHARVRRSKIFDSFLRFQLQIERLRNAIDPSHISYVSTLTKGTVEKGARAYIDSCQDLGIDRIFSRPVMPYGFAIETSSALGVEDTVWWMFAEEYLDEVIKRHERGTTFIDDYYTMYLRKLMANDTCGYVDLMSPAGYALSCCILNYDGYVYGSDESRMLYEATKDQSLRISQAGSTTEADRLEDQVAILADSFIEVTPHCDLCAFQPFCGSDPIHHIYTQNDPIGFKLDSHVCKSSKNVFGMLAERIYDGRIPPELMKIWLS
ncbi:4Fe-4S cluster-binding domain-containing protein [Luminiphilus sp.]|nr:4Fe-4S cluster-binding domain-containing protein [Luminiphilus sp.]